MTEVKYKGEVLSFWKLLEESKIVIPIIQRDYAQGREDKEEIRENFLLALRDSVENNHPRKLDFIYGNLVEKVYGNLVEKVLHPLDGQQRLTTLFLLHWYAAVKEGCLAQNESIFEKFTYETRISSREFCEALVSKFKSSIDKNINLRLEVEDSPWFFLSWKKDPTIDGMLRTIQHIHELFCDVKSLWEKLTGNNPLISFYHINLKGIGLTDDLYIKMNARGKLLTPFENFKATFQILINENKWDENKDILQTFALKIDTVWTDLFWSSSKNKHIDFAKNIDNAFIRFISTIAMCRKSIKKSEKRTEYSQKKLIEYIQNLQNEPNTVKPSFFDEEDFKYLCDAFDKYSEVHNSKTDLKLDFPFFEHSQEENIFTAVVYEKKNASYSQKALFYAQTEYLLNVDEFDKEKFGEWMRVIRNIIAGGAVKRRNRPTIVQSPETYAGVISLIHELSSGCKDIYTYLSTNTTKSSFARNQTYEEKLKSELIVSDVKNKEVIFKTEDTKLLRGRISFALFCIDFNTDKPKPENFNREKLEKINKIISKYFNRDEDISNDLRRALLTISDDGNFHYYNYWWGYSSPFKGNKRCLLDSKLVALEYFIYGYENKGVFMIYLKKLILELFDDTLTLAGIAEKFSPPSNMPNWQFRLIKETDLLDNKCESNHIVIPHDEPCVYLLKGVQPRDKEGSERIV